MTDSIVQKCKKLYMDAFHDDQEFTDLLFDRFFDSSCEYIYEDGEIISMLFAIDVTLDNLNGKYVYAVATNEKYRGKGYMSRLFQSVYDKYSNDFDFLCLKPMSESLFDYYSRLGFERSFKKSQVILNECFSAVKLKKICNVKQVRKVRKLILKENYVDYCDGFFELLLSYCDMLTDDKENPSVFVVKEKLSGKVKEAIGDLNLLSSNFANIPLLTMGKQFDFAMVKFLNENRFEDKYLGFALD